MSIFVLGLATASGAADEQRLLLTDASVFLCTPKHHYASNAGIISFARRGLHAYGHFITSNANHHQALLSTSASGSILHAKAAQTLSCTSRPAIYLAYPLQASRIACASSFAGLPQQEA